MRINFKIFHHPQNKPSVVYAIELVSISKPKAEAAINCVVDYTKRTNGDVFEVYWKDEDVEKAMLYRYFRTRTQERFLPVLT